MQLNIQFLFNDDMIFENWWYSQAPQLNTADVGTGKKAAVFQNPNLGLGRQYWEGGDIGRGGIRRGGIEGDDCMITEHWLNNLVLLTMSICFMMIYEYDFV